MISHVNWDSSNEFFLLTDLAYLKSVGTFGPIIQYILAEGGILKRNKNYNLSLHYVLKGQYCDINQTFSDE